MIKVQISIKGNHVFRDTDNEIEVVCRVWERKKGCGEGEGEELPQNKCRCPEKFLTIIRLYALNTR